MFPVEFLCALVALACSGAALACVFVLGTAVCDMVVGEELSRHDVGSTVFLVLWLGFSAAVLFDVLHHLAGLLA